MLNVISGTLSVGAPPIPPETNSYESIATYTVGSGGSASITFNSIPSTYKHLQVRWSAKTDRADTDDVVLMQFNSDTSANYSWHWLRGNGSAAAAGATSSASNIAIQYGASGNSGATSVFGGAVLDILNYQDTNKYKTTRSLQGFDLNGSGWIYLTSGNWRSTSAVTSITLDQQYGSNFAEYSKFVLYGIKGQTMAAGSTYTPLATTTLGSDTASYTFSSISGSYTDLILLSSVSSTHSGTTSFVLQFNSDTATNYSSTRLLGDGSSASSDTDPNITSARLALIGNSSSEFNPVITQLNNYSNATTYKTILTRGNYASGYVTAYSGLWRSTSAITSV